MHAHAAWLQSLVDCKAVRARHPKGWPGAIWKQSRLAGSSGRAVAERGKVTLAAGDGGRRQHAAPSASGCGCGALLSVAHCQHGAPQPAVPGPCLSPPKITPGLLNMSSAEDKPRAKDANLGVRINTGEKEGNMYQAIIALAFRPGSSSDRMADLRVGQPGGPRLQSQPGRCPASG
jgi:hypothetical protein